MSLGKRNEKLTWHISTITGLKQFHKKSINTEIQGS